MKLEFQRARLECYEPIVDAVMSQEATVESIVPDAFPDISHIVCTLGDAYITTKQALLHSAKVMGIIRLHVLYIPEGESVPRSLSLDLPFQCSGDFPQITEKDILHGNVISVSADARILNPRKLFVKAEVKVQVHCYSSKCCEVFCDLSEISLSIQTQKSEYKFHSILAALEKPFSFSDTLRPSQAKPEIEELLTYHAEAAGVDTRYIGNKLICKGILLLDGLYRSGDELVSYQFELPFSQILELEGAFEEGTPDALISLKDVNCTLRDGELDVIIDAVIQAKIWSQQTVTMLSDLYSTVELLDVERSMIPLCTHAERGSSRESVRKFCESGIPVKQILMSSVSLNPLNSKKEDQVTRYSTTAVVNLLYLSEDDAFCGVSYALPVTCDLEVPQGFSCSCACRPTGDVLAAPVTGGIEVRLETDFDWIMTKNDLKPCVATVKKSSMDVSAVQSPSLMIRMVSKGETLWDVAKACRSTIQDICIANELSSEYAELGAMLLIPTKRD